jgi:hypothetical protein
MCRGSDRLERPLKFLKGPGKMKSGAERCAEYEKFKKIDAAFRAGDFSALPAAVDDPDSIANGAMPLTIGSCLEYAIYHRRLQKIFLQ